MTSIDTQPCLDVARRMLAAADSDIPRFFGFFTDDAVFRMGNNDPVTGRDAVVAWVSDYLGAVTALRHHILEEFVSGDVVALRVEVTYSMRNGAEFTLPAVTRTRVRCGQVSEYLIFMDPSPVVEAS
jgi:ketosteroid isomerase-like protein